MTFLKSVYTSKTPTPVGPYSQAIRVGPWLICSGQIPFPFDGRKVWGDEIGDYNASFSKECPKKSYIL